jgi:hypothetical protein
VARAGPERGVGELAGQVARNADVSGLEITDPDLAASHYLSLADTARRSFSRESPAPPGSP